MLLGQETLVLALHIHAPVGWIFKLLTAGLHDFNSLGVGAAHKGLLGHFLQAGAQSLIHKLAEEFKIPAGIIQHGAGNVLDEGFCNVHIAVDVAESHFRLNHPELSSVTGGIAVLRTESRTEGIDIAQGAGKGFTLQLAGNSQIGRLAEEIIVVPLILSQGVHRRHAEHLTSAFAVAGCDDGSMNPHEIALQEELVHRSSHAGTGAENSTKQVGTRAQVRNRAQEFRGVTLLLQRISLRSRTHKLDFSRLDFPLLLAWALYEATQNAHGRTCRHATNILIAGNTGICHHLDGGQAGAVVHLQEGKSLGIAAGTHPAFHQNLLCRSFAGQRMFD